MIKVTYIISKIDKALEFEWVADYLSSEFELEFILLGKKDSQLAKYLYLKKIKHHELNYHSKKDVLKSFFKVWFVLLQTRPDIVHCHLFDATQIGLPAAWLAGIKQRIYTRHHSSYNHVYHPHAVKYDKLSNRFATKIVSISKNVSNILVKWEKVSIDKIISIPHGINYNLFSNSSQDAIARLKEKYGFESVYPVIGVISRYTYWKGIQYIIPAFKKLLIEYPEAILVLANAKKGDYKSEIEELLKDIPSTNYREIEFESEVHVLYHCFDVFVHTPIDEHSEAFGQIYIEALASKVQCVFTSSGVALDFENLNLAKFINHKDSDQIYQAITTLIDKGDVPEVLSMGSEYIKEHYSLEQKIDRLKNLYNRL